MEFLLLSATKKCYYTFLFVFFLVGAGYSQEERKIEIEKAISDDDFPDEAVRMVQPILEKAYQVRYFFETGGRDTSYEAKFVYGKQKISIEFNQKGQLQDIEQLVEFSSLEKNIKASIKQVLNENFRKSKITRCQIQFTELKQSKGTNPVQAFINKKWDSFKLAYELEVRVKTKAGEITNFEILFDDKGAFLKKRKITNPGDDILLY